MTTAAAPDAARIAAARARLAQRAAVAPPPDWLPVVIGGAAVGVATPAVVAFLSAADLGFRRTDRRLVLDDGGAGPEQRSALLARAAQALAAAGLLRGWRNERLDVRAAPGAAPLAVIERAACRTLGITTEAVHLNAFAADGTLVVARRADHKQIDPGLWDNLVGGMVPAGESLAAALAREAQEEAGLDLARLAVTAGGQVHVTRLVPEGYQSEIVHVFDCVLPPTTTLANEDGEVAAIETRSAADVLAAIERDEFTLESALVTLDALARRAGH